MRALDEPAGQRHIGGSDAGAIGKLPDGRDAGGAVSSPEAPGGSARRDAERHPRSMTTPASPTPPTGESLLVIDNDEGLLELLAFVFTHRGFSVLTARQGADGIALAQTHRPAVIICDIIMDDMHGFEVLRT